MKLLVAMHDVTPALFSECRRMWQLCAACGVTPALGVVPNWHGIWPLERHQPFAAWLHDCVAEGAEIFLHGDRHDEVGSERGVCDTLRAVGQTAREGEFLTLDGEAAHARMQKGVAVLKGVGLSPIGFIAPAWLAREESYRVVARAGLSLSENVREVRMHDRAMAVPAPVIRWSARTGLRARMSAKVAEWRWRMHRRDPVVRIALHPQDGRHSATLRSVRYELARWVDARPVWRYAQL